ncbi:hypothetical protein [Ralstonia solanacearum]|uniref:hypothetical protein n=1 Tax=Ralstonia solanacearum TaxID=305 RepID=UPI0001D97C52|nr:hypothetical protein [Ralstonia solanacearum]CBM10150.1 hypothethical protein [Ralstonia solanacearum PSI07]
MNWLSATARQKKLYKSACSKKGAGLCRHTRKQESLGCEECFDIAKPRLGVAKARRWAAQCVIRETDYAGITDAYQFGTGSLGQIILTLLKNTVIYCFLYASDLWGEFYLFASSKNLE